MVIAALVGPLASKAAFNRDAFSESAAGYYLSTGKPARVRTFANCQSRWYSDSMVGIADQLRDR